MGDRATPAWLPRCARTTRWSLSRRQPDAEKRTRPPTTRTGWLRDQAVGQALVSTHTHAECDVFRVRTAAVHRRVQITTIDGLVAQIGGAYHLALGLPSDTADWVRAQGDTGFELLAERVSCLLAGSKVVTWRWWGVTRWSCAMSIRMPTQDPAWHRDAPARGGSQGAHLC